MRQRMRSGSCQQSIEIALLMRTRSSFDVAFHPADVSVIYSRGDRGVANAIWMSVSVGFRDSEIEIQWEPDDGKCDDPSNRVRHRSNWMV